MPLVKIFCRHDPRLDLVRTHAALVGIWGVAPEVLKMLVIPVHSMSLVDGAELFVDVRAKQKPDRTPEFVQSAIKRIGELLVGWGHSCSVRVELYEPSLQSAGTFGVSDRTPAPFAGVAPAEKPWDGRALEAGLYSSEKRRRSDLSDDFVVPQIDSFYNY